ncbi:MAG: hypothetical protein ACRDO0_04970 [Nocardioidaceae bacterium]
MRFFTSTVGAKGRDNATPNGSMRRSVVALAATALASTALLGAVNTADAVVRPGPGRNADRTTVFIRDGNGMALQLCTDAINCEAPVAPDIGSYFSAEATVGPMRAIWGIDAAFLEDEAGNPTTRAAVSNSALFRAEGLRANRRYTIRGPWGRHTCRRTPEASSTTRTACSSAAARPAALCAAARSRASCAHPSPPPASSAAWRSRAG